MPLSVKTLIKKTFETVKKDKLIFFPYLIFFLVAQLLHELLPWVRMSIAPLQPFFIHLGWAVETGFKCLTLIMAGHLYSHSHFSLKTVLKESIKKFPVLLVSTGIFVIPIITLTQSVYKDIPQELNVMLLGLFILALFLIPLSLVLEFIPMPVLLNHAGVLSGIQQAFQLVKTQFRAVLTVTALTLGLIFLTSLASLLAVPQEVSASSPTLHALGYCMEAVIQAVGYTLVYTMMAVFYLSGKEPQQVDHLIQ